MFCIQCEQTLNNKKVKGCAFATGMCGKTSEVSDLQDVLVYGLQSLSSWAYKAREFDILLSEIDEWVPKALFATLTNVNFDPARILALTSQTAIYIDLLKQKIAKAHPRFNFSDLPSIFTFTLPKTHAETLSLAAQFALNAKKDENQDLLGLRTLCLYGLKGVAAYLEHARALSKQQSRLYTEFHQMMYALFEKQQELGELLDLSMQIGMLNFKVMEQLESAAVTRFGVPTPQQVNTKPVKGKCLLVSGHDLLDLEMILEQTKGTGINVYTNGEMLPAHGYPQLKKYKHLVGNYGSAWHNQQQEFARFPGAIVMTSNCLIDPNVGHYAKRLFTRSVVGWPNVKHIEGNDFSAAIACALQENGFEQTEIEHQICVGFGRETLLSVAPAVVDEVKAGNIRHFFLIGGCDGEKTSRSYYSDFALSAPQDSILLTLGCGKFRFNQHDFGNINGIARLLDLGQCNDAYAAIMLALELSKAFELEINELPLTLVLSWFEQKAIAILLTLLALGVKGIYLGPSLPAFLSDNLLAILQEKFDLRQTGQAQEDLATCLN